MSQLNLKTRVLLQLCGYLALHFLLTHYCCTKHPYMNHGEYFYLGALPILEFLGITMVASSKNDLHILKSVHSIFKFWIIWDAFTTITLMRGKAGGDDEFLLGLIAVALSATLLPLAVVIRASSLKPKSQGITQGICPSRSSSE